MNNEEAERIAEAEASKKDKEEIKAHKRKKVRNSFAPSKNRKKVYRGLK